MIVLTIALLLSVTVLLIFLQKTVLPLMQKAKQNKRLMEEGIPAKAIILNMQQTGLYVNNLPQIKLLMQVHPQTGRNFITEAKEVLSFVDLSQMHIGSTLKIKYNPSNVKEVIVVKEPNHF